ncbi:MAG: rod shape-determining protein MreC [Fimbriimonadaceae bacterium]
MAQTRARTAGRTDLPSQLIQRVTQPPVVFVSRMADATSDFLDGITHASALKRQVAALQAQAAAVADYSEQMQREEGEVDDLRRLMQFRAVPGKSAIPAEVSGIFAYDNRITITAGSNKGVEPGMPVVSGRGLLALVQTVAPDHSEALLLVSPVTKIGAIALRNPPPAGLLVGEGGGDLYVDFLDPNAIVQSGDEIVTSGFSDRIPPNIPIGRVIRIEENVDFGTKRAVVFPWASLGAAREVYVLK